MVFVWKIPSSFLQMEDLNSPMNALCLLNIAKQENFVMSLGTQRIIILLNLR